MSKLPKGVFKTKKKDGTEIYRVSVTYRGKHISLGSFCDVYSAALCYDEAKNLLESEFTIEQFDPLSGLSFEKWVILINFRDNGIYFSTPIYLRSNFFYYYLSRDTVLKFDRDDLFFYAGKKITARGNHLFVTNFGIQENLLNRYGIMSRSVPGRDFIFQNGDSHDFRYSNIVLINKYRGVQKNTGSKVGTYTTRILVNGNIIVGTYENETEAAIAYNKAADILHKNGFTVKYATNYVEEVTAKEYAEIYNKLKISSRIINAKPI